MFYMKYQFPFVYPFNHLPHKIVFVSQRNRRTRQIPYVRDLVTTLQEGFQFAILARWDVELPYITQIVPFRNSVCTKQGIVSSRWYIFVLQCSVVLLKSEHRRPMLEPHSPFECNQIQCITIWCTSVRQNQSTFQRQPHAKSFVEFVISLHSFEETSVTH